MDLDGLYVAIGSILGLSDQAVKTYMDEQSPEYRKVLANGNIQLLKSYNRGAFLNFGEKKPEAIAMISVVLTAFIAGGAFQVLGKNRNAFSKLSLCLLTSGALSNTIDRLTRKHVIDYINFPKLPKKMSRIVYNVADFEIFLGVLLSIVGAVLEK